MTINWEGRAGKYLEECGFHAYEFGTSSNGNIDIDTQNDVVVSGVTREQGLQVINYLRDLMIRVQEHIELHYDKKRACKLETPYQLDTEQMLDNGLQVSILDSNGVWCFDCYKTDAEEILKRINMGDGNAEKDNR